MCICIYIYYIKKKWGGVGSVCLLNLWLENGSIKNGRLCCRGQGKKRTNLRPCWKHSVTNKNKMLTFQSFPWPNFMKLGKSCAWCLRWFSWSQNLPQITTLGVIWPGHLPEFIRITGINWNNDSENKKLISKFIWCFALSWISSTARAACAAGADGADGAGADGTNNLLPSSWPQRAWWHIFR